jgi:hypothetical protein
LLKVPERYFLKFSVDFLAYAVAAAADDRLVSIDK